MHINWWTLALQTVNVLVLIWILGRFFFRPIMDVVAKRQAAVDRLLADADAARKEATNLHAEAENVHREIGAERARLMMEARKEAEAEKAHVLKAAQGEIAKRHSEAEASIVRDRAAAQADIVARASELAVEIARRLLARFPPQIALPAFLDGLCRELRALSPESKAQLASFAAGESIEVVSAAPLSDAEAEHVRSVLEQTFGDELTLSFRSDLTLIAGIELHGRNTIIRNSWRADLDRIREDLNRDKQPRQS
jgi:F-type H+-transporting ATPase subunit b